MRFYTQLAFNHRHDCHTLTSPAQKLKPFNALIKHFYTQTLYHAMHNIAWLTHRLTFTAQKLKPSMHWSHSLRTLHTEGINFYTQTSLVATHRPSRTYAGYSEPRVTTYRRQARYKSRTISYTDPASCFYEQTEHKLAVDTRKIDAVLHTATLCTTSNDFHTLMTTCSRLPKSTKTSTTATKRSFGHANSHVYSDSSGGAGSSLVTVWRRNIRNDIWKLCYRQSRRGVSRQDSEKCKTIVCIANTFTHRRFLHTDAFTHKAFTHRGFYTNTFYTNTFTHRSFYIQTLLHTDAFTHKRFDTQTLLHTDAFYTQTLFTHRRFHTQTHLHTEAFYTQTLLHKHFYTQTLLHTDAFTHRRFDTQTLLHTDAFTHRDFYTQTLFTHRRFYTQTRTAQVKSQFYLSFCRSTLISCERVAPAQVKSHFYLSFCRSTLISIDPHFVRKGCSGTSKIALLPQFLPIDPHFVRKGCFSTSKIAILPQFLPIDPHFVRKGCSGTSQIAILPQFLPIDPHFVRKGLTFRDSPNRQFHPRP